MNGLGLLGILAVVAARPSLAAGRESPFLRYPPYRLTDAETAERWTLEARLGLLRIEREAQQNSYASPLLRFNLGLPGNLEAISEFEYRADEGRIGDWVLGFKWVPVLHSASFGVENLTLVPLPGETGAGIESNLLATLRAAAVNVHLNAGGFYDGRPAVAEYGWKGGVIGEAKLGRLRPGVEVFAKRVRSDPVELSAGPGVIANLGAFDARAGFAVGITRATPDFRVSLWVTSKGSIVSTL